MGVSATVIRPFSTGDVATIVNQHDLQILEGPFVKQILLIILSVRCGSEMAALFKEVESIFFATNRCLN